MNKILWLINLRWIVLLLFILLIPILYLFQYFFSFSIPHMGALMTTIVTLFSANSLFTLYYTYLKKRLNKLKEDEHEVKDWKQTKFISLTHHDTLFYFFLVQMGIDYLLVSYLAFNFGLFPFNFTLLYLPHIFLSSILFHKKRVSYTVTLIAVILTGLFCYLHQNELVQTLLEVYPLFPQKLISYVPALNLFYLATLFTFLNYLTSILVKTIIHQKEVLEESNNRLIKLDKEKQSYTLRATHELKSPFAAIQSYVQVIRAGHLGPISQPVSDILDKINSRCSQLTQMIKSIIQLSNLRTSPFEKEHFIYLDLAPFLEEKLKSFEVEARVKKVIIVNSFQIESPQKIKVIHDLFSILLDNLITNAIKYSVESGKIEITTSLSPLNKNKIRIEVRDEGIGIPPEHLENIFTEHFRCNNGVEVNRSGNGMGLAIVKEIATIHRGEIEVQSTLLKGSSFVFTFPLQ